MPPIFVAAARVRNVTLPAAAAAAAAVVAVYLVAGLTKEAAALSLPPLLCLDTGALLWKMAGGREKDASSQSYNI